MPALFPYREAASRAAGEAADLGPAPAGSPAPEGPARGPDVAGWLIVTQGLGLLWLVAWAGLLGDGPAHLRSVHNFGELLVAIVIIAYPLFLLASAALAWWARRRGRNRRAVVLSLVPLLPILLHLAFVSYQDETDCCAMPDTDTTVVSPTP